MRRETVPSQPEATGAPVATIVEQPRLGPQPARPAPKRTQPLRPKHVPQRTCIVCRDRTPKRTLVRIVRTPEGTVEVDPTGKRNGRGAYLCPDPRCWDRATSGPMLGRALKTEIDDETRERLKAFARSLATVSERADESNASERTR